MSEREDNKSIQKIVGTAADGIWGKNSAAATLAYLRKGGQSAPVEPADRVVNAAGVELIQHFESCLEPIGDGRFQSYPDAGYGWSVATIGWGSTYYPDGAKVKQGDTLSQAECDALFEFELAEKSDAVVELIEGEPTTDDEFAALSSFAYNAGQGNLASSTLLKKHMSGDHRGAADEFLKWVYSNGKKLAGLERRRRAERSLYLSLIVDYI